MKVAPVADVKARLSAYLDHAESTGPVVITRNGKAVAVLISPLNDDDLEQLVLSRSPRFLAMLERSRKSIAAGKGLSTSDFWKQAKQRTKPRSAAKALRS
jgi:prevent-host-death family protein